MYLIVTQKLRTQMNQSLINKSTNNSRYPIVGIPCDVTRYGLSAFHGVGEKYINAVMNGADPLLIPAQGPGEDLLATDSDVMNERLLDNLDGLFLSGSPSNIDPTFYSDEESTTPDQHDPQRDCLNLPLIRAAIKRKIPILAVCRGMQEVNVALGGSLHQKVHEQPKMLNHQEDKSLDREGQYDVAHSVQLVTGGILASLLGTESAMVNSLHGQGMNRLADNLIAEATAEDGLVEAFRIDNDEQYLIGVQWHPEWKFHENPLSTALFASFGKAVRAYQNR
jgi:putative glutamine amidotransferase